MRPYLPWLHGLLQALMLILLVSFAIFLAFQLIPSDAAIVAGGIEADEQLVASLRQEYGLDQSFALRFALWFGGLLQGDLGISSRYKVPVVDLVRSHLVVTGALTLLALTFTACFAFATSAVVVMLGQRRFASWVAIASQVFLAVPQFWLALVVIQVFGLMLGWFNLFYSRLELREFIFPALVLALMQSAYLSRYLIYAWQRETKQSYVLSALARGVPRNRLRFMHALRGSLIPATTVLGLIWVDLLSGSVIVETLFGLPGLGQLLISAVAARDLVLVQGIVLYFVVIVMVANLLVRTSQRWLNPKARTAVDDY